MVVSNETANAAHGTKQITEMVTLGIIGCSSLIGNSLVIAVISRSHRIQWVTNLFVAHLAVVNLSTPIFAVPLHFYWILKSSWALGNVTCKLVHFLHHLNAGVSVCMLACMALDRYYVVLHPLTLHLRRSQTFQLITFIWIFIIFLSTPSLYFYKLEKIPSGRICTVENNIKENSSWGGFFIVFSLCGFFSPLFILIFFYILVLKAIHERDIFARKQKKIEDSAMTIQRNSAEGPKSQQKYLGKVPKTKRKVIRLLMIQNIFFITCWLPYFVKELTKLWKPSNGEIGTVYLWLSFSNASINPILYALLNSNFRKGCRHLINVNLSHPYTLQSLQRRHQVGITESSHRGSEDEGIGKNHITPEQSRHRVLFHKEKSLPLEKDVVSNANDSNQQLTKIFQASSVSSVDAWASRS